MQDSIVIENVEEVNLGEKIDIFECHLHKNGNEYPGILI